MERAGGCGEKAGETAEDDGESQPQVRLGGEPGGVGGGGVDTIPVAALGIGEGKDSCAEVEPVMNGGSAEGGGILKGERAIPGE